MALAPDLERLAGRVNVQLLSTRIVVVVGVGAVGSQVAYELANAGVGRLRLIDHDRLQPENLRRHALKNRCYLGMNKAEAMTLYLTTELRITHAEAIPLAVNVSLSDRELDQLLDGAYLIVAATGDPTTQRRIGRRALSLDIPTVFPSLAERNGGEIFVQFGPGLPCFYCWHRFRHASSALQGVSALNIDILPIASRATYLALGILDTDSDYADLLKPAPGQAPPQLFIQNNFVLGAKSIRKVRGCPACAVGPSSLRNEESITTESIRTRTLTRKPNTYRCQKAVRGTHTVVLTALRGTSAVAGAVLAGWLMLWAITLAVYLVLIVVLCGFLGLPLHAVVPL
jgi:hypothetical protein